METAQSPSTAKRTKTTYSKYRATMDSLLKPESHGEKDVILQKPQNDLSKDLEACAKDLQELLEYFNQVPFPFEREHAQAMHEAFEQEREDLTKQHEHALQRLTAQQEYEHIEAAIKELPKNAQNILNQRLLQQEKAHAQELEKMRQKYEVLQNQFRKRELQLQAAENALQKRRERLFEDTALLEEREKSFKKVLENAQNTFHQQLFQQKEEHAREMKRDNRDSKPENNIAQWT